MINDHLFEGRFSPIGADGKRISRNVYAKNREECEAKLAELVIIMKQEIAGEKERLTSLGKGETMDINGIHDGVESPGLQLM